MPNLRTLIRVYANRVTRESAMAASVFALVENRISRHVQYVEFCTRFGGGQEFNTNNSGEMSSFPRPGVLNVRAPWVNDVGELYTIHRAITSAKAPADAKVLRLDTIYDGDAAAFAAGGMREELQQAEQIGYMRLTSSGTKYRPTLKGAYLMTWRNLPPFKWIVAWRERRAVERLLAEVGFK